MRPSFGKIESSSKLMNSFTALEIFSAIEDGCLDGGHGAPSEPIRRLSHTKLVEGALRVIGRGPNETHIDLTAVVSSSVFVSFVRSEN